MPRVQKACADLLSIFMTELGSNCSVYWDEPYKGSATDEFKLEGETLEQTSKMIMKDSELNCSYKTVYTRNRACVRGKSKGG